ncbi:hypothetical protein Anapl_09148 [Anas platyrhynchos]|uniref:Uncharacterized protein n=1 Tax=Anas platyrhynchos TaxID=8839 RepID=R0M0E0_ANAPL|nr:hypothetical protein Anapl_09148 [Anas platyrhynchos]
MEKRNRANWGLPPFLPAKLVPKQLLPQPTAPLMNRTPEQQQLMFSQLSQQPKECGLRYHHARARKQLGINCVVELRAEHGHGRFAAQQNLLTRCSAARIRAPPAAPPPAA